jgi:hypothetical protein
MSLEFIDLDLGVPDFECLLHLGLLLALGVASRRLPLTWTGRDSVARAIARMSTRSSRSPRHPMPRPPS